MLNKGSMSIVTVIILSVVITALLVLIIFALLPKQEKKPTAVIPDSDLLQVKSNYPNQSDVEKAFKLVGFEYVGVNDYKYLEFKHQQTGIVMVLIPSGSFMMGSSDGDKNAPVHEVSLDSYLIGKYEVKQSQWEKVMGNNPSYFKGPDNPVETISWNDCQRFCSRTGLNLPTEAQWERACRAGTSTKYYWGDEMNEAYYNSGDKTIPVGQKQPNAFGLYDMSGNVWEWCQDFYGNYASDKQANPTGPSNGDSYVRRGGSWHGDTKHGRCSARNSDTPDDRDFNLGFRVSESLHGN